MTAPSVCGLLLVLVFSTGLFLPERTLAQEDPVPTDSLREYRLSEIVIGADAERRVRPVRTAHRVSLAGIARQDAADISGVMRLLPSTHLQTNSRGETLVYVRGAGERQVALFLDGASMNIPWDNRLDLSLIPSNILGGMTVARGAVSAVYGANTAGGAISMQTRDIESDGSLTDVTGQIGTGRSYEVRGMHVRRSGGFSAIAAATMEGSDGFPLPEDAEVPFSQSGDLRTNTDRMIGNAFVRVSGRGSDDDEWGLSLMHIEAEKGIAPEAHLDPARERVRFWRYPEWRNSMAVLNGRRRTGSGLDLRGTIWAGRFEQQIDQYDSADYEELTDRQDDRDLTAGARVIAVRPAGMADVRIVGNMLYSVHDQQDRSFTSTDDGEIVFDETFSQVLFSSGLEADAEPGPRVRARMGATIDALLTPRTGDKPGRDPFLEPGLNAHVAYGLDEMTTMRIAGGRKARFPTMRELFGEALDQFLVNADLTAERTWIGEAALKRTGEYVSGEIVAFIHRTFDTIDRRNVEVDGRRLRQRVNLEGSRVIGVEIVGAVEPDARLRLDGHLTIMDPVAYEGGETVNLVEKPGVLGTLSASFRPVPSLTLSAQSVYTGRAYSLAPDNELVRLPTSLVLNLRASAQRFMPASGVFLQVYAGVDNISDELRIAQLGLPGAGRTFRAGLSLSR